MLRWQRRQGQRRRWRRQGRQGRQGLDTAAAVARVGASASRCGVDGGARPVLRFPARASLRSLSAANSSDRNRRDRRHAPAALSGLLVGCGWVGLGGTTPCEAGNLRWPLGGRGGGVSPRACGSSAEAATKTTQAWFLMRTAARSLRVVEAHANTHQDKNTGNTPPPPPHPSIFRAPTEGGARKMVTGSA